MTTFFRGGGLLTSDDLIEEEAIDQEPSGPPSNLYKEGDAAPITTSDMLFGPTQIGLPGIEPVDTGPSVFAPVFDDEDVTAGLPEEKEVITPIDEEAAPPREDIIVPKPKLTFNIHGIAGFVCDRINEVLRGRYYSATPQEAHLMLEAFNRYGILVAGGIDLKQAGLNLDFVSVLSGIGTLERVLMWLQAPEGVHTISGDLYHRAFLSRFPDLAGDDVFDAISAALDFVTGELAVYFEQLAVWEEQQAAPPPPLPPEEDIFLPTPQETTPDLFVPLVDVPMDMDDAGLPVGPGIMPVGPDASPPGYVPPGYVTGEHVWPTPKKELPWPLIIGGALAALLILKK